MTKDNMTIRFTPDGFSFIDAPNATSAQLDLAPFHEVAPGPDFQQRLHQAVLDLLPEAGIPSDLTVEPASLPDLSAETASQPDLTAEPGLLPDLTVEILSERVILLPPHVTGVPDAELMFATTLSEPQAPEQVLLQPVALPSGQQLSLCFAIDRELYLFLTRNFGDIRFTHHLASLLAQGPAAPCPVCGDTIAAPSQPAAPCPVCGDTIAAPTSPSQPAAPCPVCGDAIAAPASPSQPAPALLLARCLDHWLELALFRAGRLILANIYPTSSADNRTYYVLNTWLRSGLDQLHDRLLILGNGDPATQLHQDLRPFIKQINC